MGIDRKVLAHIVFAIGFLSLPFNTTHADFTYNWIPERGSGGSGFFRISETNITDHANFEVLANQTNLLEVFFEFDNGLMIKNAVGFDPALTIQTDPQIVGHNTLYANKGIISQAWTFSYRNRFQIIPQDEYENATATEIYCIVNPCPIIDADVRFIGPRLTEINRGTFKLQEVPLPAAISLMVPALALVGGLRRKACKGT